MKKHGLHRRRQGIGEKERQQQVQHRPFSPGVDERGLRGAPGNGGGRPGGLPRAPAATALGRGRPVAGDRSAGGVDSMTRPILPI